MMEPADLLTSMGQMLRDEGFEGRGRNWRLGSPEDEVIWWLQLEKVPRVNEVGMYLGADLPRLLDGPRPKRGNDCPLVLHPDSHRGAAGVDAKTFRPALDLDHDMPDEERLAYVKAGISRISSYVRRHSSVGHLGAAYRAGDFRGEPIKVVVQDLLKKS